MKNICKDADQVLEQFLCNQEEDCSHCRMEQQKIKCGYGLDGVCCKLCSNGPCRISRARPKGVCGADADTIVARNFLRSVAAGAGCYIHVLENTARRLREAALNHHELPGKGMLADLCSMLGITGQNESEQALHLAETILADIRRPADEKMELVEKIAYSKRLEVWRKNGFLPGGIKDEIFNAVVKTSTNLSSDPVDMLVQCLRLGISTGAYGLVLTNLLNDILIGEPTIDYQPVGMQVIKPDYVNILITGHQQSMFIDLMEQLQKEEIQKFAYAVGAKGIKVVGCTCVGQDFQLRDHYCADMFAGYAGNNYASEAVLMTGCIDLVVSEFNCTLPGIEPICKKLNIPMLCLDDVAKKKPAVLSPYTDADKTEITGAIVATSILSYEKRHQNRTNPLANHGQKETVLGVTERSLKQRLGGSFQPLIDAIAQGKIKGIAAVVGCSNLRANGHDVFTVDLVRQLIQKDILVLSAGCTCGGLGNCGLMDRSAIAGASPALAEVCRTLDLPPVLNFGPCLAIGRIDLLAGELAAALQVDFPQLPVVVSAPQWLEEQALADGAFALTLGFPLHLGLAPFVTGSSLVTDVLCNQMKDLTGGTLFIETDASAAAQKMQEIIEEKRKGLGL